MPNASPSSSTVIPVLANVLSITLDRIANPLILSAIVPMSVPNNVACAPAPSIICLKLPRSVIPLAVALMNDSLISPPARPVVALNSETASVIALTSMPAPSASSLALIRLSSKVPALSATSHKASAN